MSHHMFEIETRGPGLYEVTDQVARWVAGFGTKEAVLTLMIQHTSASLVIQENADPEVRVDLTNFFGRLVPPTTDPAIVPISPIPMRGRTICQHISRRPCCPPACPFLLFTGVWGWEHGKVSTFSNIGSDRIDAGYWRCCRNDSVWDLSVPTTSCG